MMKYMSGKNNVFEFIFLIVLIKRERYLQILMSTPLPPISGSSGTASRQTEPFQVSSVRGDMMKMQQVIQRLTSQYESVIQAVPARLPERLVNLQSAGVALDSNITTETSFNYSASLKELRASINNLQKDFDAHIEETRMQLSNDNFTVAVAQLEQEINQVNNDWLRRMEELIEKRLEKYEKAQSRGKETVELHLKSSFGDDSGEPEVIEIETTAPINPEMQRRVVKHSERVRLIEDRFTDVLAKEIPAMSPVQYIKAVKKAVKTNGAFLNELDNDYDFFEDSLKNKSEKEKKAKVEQYNPEKIVQKGDFDAFSLQMFDKLAQISSLVEAAVVNFDKTCSDVDDGIQTVSKRINGYEQSAANIEAIIDEMKARVTIMDTKERKTSGGIDEDKELMTSVQNGIDRLRQMRKETEDEIDKMRKQTLEIKKGWKQQ